MSEGGGVLQRVHVALGQSGEGGVALRIDEDIGPRRPESFVVLQHREQQEVVAPHLLQLGAENALPPVWLECRGLLGDLLVAGQSRHRVRFGLGDGVLVVLRLDPDHGPRRATRLTEEQRYVERRTVPGVAGVVTAGRPLELDGLSLPCHVPQGLAGGGETLRIVMQLAEQVEAHRHRGEEVVEKPGLLKLLRRLSLILMQPVLDGFDDSRGRGSSRRHRHPAP